MLVNFFKFSHDTSMRFMKLFAGITLLFGLVIGSYLVGRDQVYLWLATRQVKEAFREVATLSPLADHFEQCQNKVVEGFEFGFDESNTGSIEGYQLRFLDDHSYVIEMLCKNDRRETDFTRLSEHSLPGNTRKTGGVGILVNLDRQSPKHAWVYLARGRFTTRVGYDTDRLVAEWNGMEASNSFGSTLAKATCEGYGYYCCSPEAGVGVGLQQAGSLNCQDNCYAMCQERPSLLFFNTEPLLNQVSRIVQAPKFDAEVVFGYEIQDADSSEVSVIVDFGDGTEFTGAKKATLSHTYVCDESECVFDVVLHAVDSEGNELTQNERNRIRVKVN